MLLVKINLLNYAQLEAFIFLIYVSNYFDIYKINVWG